jgi:hypothetical protein
MRACIIQHVISASLFEEKTVACFDQYADKTPSAGILLRRRLKGAVQRITTHRNADKSIAAHGNFPSACRKNLMLFRAFSDPFYQRSPISLPIVN